jgi:hypothetical protein
MQRDAWVKRLAKIGKAEAALAGHNGQQMRREPSEEGNPYRSLSGFFVQAPALAYVFLFFLRELLANCEMPDGVLGCIAPSSA